MHLSKINKGILCMINCHQNKNNGQKEHKMALNSQNCFNLFAHFKQHHILNLVN